tara:strand:+ start:2167 stop:2430 length:264 start_codon:yes stop_codon:yes gene_type:complete
MSIHDGQQLIYNQCKIILHAWQALCLRASGGVQGVIGVMVAKQQRWRCKVPYIASTAAHNGHGAAQARACVPYARFNVNAMDTQLDL